MNLTFGHLELFVNSPAKSVEFYENILGFKLNSDQGENFKWIKSGDTEILFRKGISKNKSDSYHNSNIALCIYCDNINLFLEKLKSQKINFTFIDNSTECVALQDPDGNWIQVVQNIK